MWSFYIWITYQFFLVFTSTLLSDSVVLGEWRISSAQSLSHVWLFTTPWTAVCQASLSITSSRSLLRLIQWCHLIISSCCPLLLLPSVFPRIRVFSSVSEEEEKPNPRLQVSSSLGLSPRTQVILLWVFCTQAMLPSWITLTCWLPFKTFKKRLARFLPLHSQSLGRQAEG